MNLSSYRFPQSELTLKPGKVSGQSALCLVYADVRAYQDALDQLGIVWSSSVQAVGPKAVVVELTLILNEQLISRSATGEDTDLMSAEARAFKRACSAFGLGRYLYDIELGWQPFDGKHFGQAAYTALAKAVPAAPAITPTSEPWAGWSEPQDAYSWAVSAGYATSDQHARNALKKVVELDFGGAMKQSNWPSVAEAFYHNRLQRREEKEAVLR